MDGVQTLDCKTAGEFLEYLRWSQDRWGPAQDFASPWLFRGQSNADWELLPRAWRPGCRLIRRAERAVGARARELAKGGKVQSRVIESESIVFGHAPEARRVRLAQRVLAEFTVLHEFLDLADAVGLAIPGAFSINSPEEMLYWWDEPLDHLEEDHRQLSLALVLAQHHGLPTRCLDWTRDPMKAAFFASYAEGGVHEETGRIAVWAVHLDGVTSSKRLDLVTCERHRHGYLHAQNALTTIDNGANRFFLDNGRWPSFAEAFSEGSGSQVVPIRLITLPVSEAKIVQQQLWMEHLSVVHLMPTYDNVVRALSQKWAWIDPEE